MLVTVSMLVYKLIDPQSKLLFKKVFTVAIYTYYMYWNYKSNTETDKIFTRNESIK